MDLLISYIYIDHKTGGIFKKSLRGSLQNGREYHPKPSTNKVRYSMDKRSVACKLDNLPDRNELALEIVEILAAALKSFKSNIEQLNK